jgi:dipeptidyl aminopeptidase/acylaminoacyl peptidase
MCEKLVSVPKSASWRRNLQVALFAGAMGFTLSSAVSAQQLKTLTLADYPRWSRIADVQLSDDGKWMSYAYTPNEGDGTLFIRDLAGSTVHKFVRGSAPIFSPDSRFVAYTISPPGQSAGRGGRAGGGGGGRGGAPGQGRGAQAPAAPAAPGRTLHLFDLQTGQEVFSTPDPQTTVFAPDSRYLAVRRNPGTREGSTHQGSDFVLRNLADGTTLSLGNVSSFAFNKAGTQLAYLVDAAGKSGNGVYMLDVATGAMRPLDTDTMRYDDITWDREGLRLAVLRGETPRNAEQRVNTLLTFTTTTGKSLTNRSVYDPSKDAAFPKEMVLSELGSLTWSRDGTRVFVAAKQQKEKFEEPTGGDPRSNVEIWHWADDRLLSVQKVQAETDRRATFTGAVAVATGKFTTLADVDMPRVQVTRDGRWAIGLNDKPYRRSWDDLGGLQDMIRIDVANGARTTLVQGVRQNLGISPDSRYQLWFKDGKLWVSDIASGARTDLSALSTENFTNTDDEQPIDKPSFGVAGWSRDGKSVLINGRYDVWQLPLVAGGKAVNLTRGLGARDEVRFRIVNLNTDPDDDGSIDTAKPIVLSAYGEWTKKSGYFTLEPGKELRPLIWQDKQISALRKAKNADRVIFTAQTFQEFPDYWTSTTALASPVKVTDANPQQAEYAWGKRILVDYVDQRGNKLQGTLALPANYQPGRKYPMLVYFYEKMSQNHHTYSMPTYDDRPHMSTYASDGYLVLQPDIVYTWGKPGSSALDDVTSAVKKVIELGYADPARVGAQGHSWGGYESSYIVTQTDMFAATVTGAPLTNLESMHNILYKQSGGGNAPLIQWGQGRMGTVPWEDLANYADQSAVHHVKNIKTPFLIMHGTADGAVDWNQGLEFYVAARRAGKQVILLSYPDEPHHLARKENQKDFQVRMKQYFDHYLKGTPAPKWMSNGVLFLDRAREVVVTTDGGTRN